MKKYIGSFHSQSFSPRTFRAAEVEPRERGQEPPDVVREAQRGAAEVGHGAAGQPGQAGEDNSGGARCARCRRKPISQAQF